MAKKHWLEIIRSEVQETIAVSDKRELTCNEKKLLGKNTISTLEQETCRAFNSPPT